MSTQEIPISEIEFECLFFLDDSGRVFRWKDGVYRAIRSHHVSFYRSLFEEKDIQALFERGLVETHMTSLSLGSYPLVLKHKRIHFKSYPMEWNFEMLKDAALMVCDLGLALWEQGLTFKDAHPWNILFNGSRPVFVDWGSIGPRADEQEWPYLEFRAWFLFPLYLMSAGLSNLARSMMFDFMNRLNRGDTFRLLIKRVPPLNILRYWLHDNKHLRSSLKPGPEFFYSLRHTIESIPMGMRKTEWTEYQGAGDCLPIKSCERRPEKVRNAHSVLKRIGPKSVLDIGCGKGWFAQLAAREGAEVVAVDIDESNIIALYQRAKDTGLRILPIVMDICSPTPMHGVVGSYPAAQERLRADMVASLATTHHLVFKRGLTFEGIAELLASLTTKWLLVEFVPPEDSHVSEWLKSRADKYAWYTLDNFKGALSRFFGRIEVLESSPPPRVLLFCEK